MPAETARDKGHATGKFDVLTGKQKASKSNAPSYTKVFADSLLNHAAHDTKICLLYTSPSPRDATLSRMPSSA